MFGSQVKGTFLLTVTKVQASISLWTININHVQEKKKHEKTRPATATLEYFGYVSETQPTGPETSLSPGHRPVGFPPMATSKKAFLVTLGVTLA